MDSYIKRGVRVFVAAMLIFLLNAAVANSTTLAVQKDVVHKFMATSYCLKGITRMGTRVARGTIAVDPRVIPLGSKVEIIEPERYAGIYTAYDTGGAIKGRIIDVWTPTYREAINFGRRHVKLRVLSDNEYNNLTARISMLNRN